MIVPHQWTPEEESRFERLRDMRVDLLPGMHVLDILYPHADEAGGAPCDHIIVTRYPGGSGCHTAREDWRGAAGTVVGYYVPKLHHLETFVACLHEAVLRGARELPLPGYGEGRDPQFKDKYPFQYLVGIVELWRKPEWQDQVIESLVDVLIAHPPVATPIKAQPVGGGG